MRPTVPPDYPDDPIAEPVHRGRGALSNESSRFDSERRIRTTDGWETEASVDPTDDEELPPLRTTLTRDATRTIIARNTSPDIGFDRSINPYRGCEHGCIYCFARPTHAYLGLSPGLDFETKILFKPDAAKLLTAELASPKYRPDVIAMGTNTDPYQPVERELKITRQILRRAERVQQSGGHRHQGPAHHARHRHPGRHGQAQPGRGLRVDHHARQGPGAGDGAARLGAAPPARGDPRAVGGRHPDRRHDGADDPGAERPRDGSDPRGGEATRAPRAQASPSCACRSRSRNCSRNGCASTGPTAPRRCCRWFARCAAARSTRPSSACACAARARSPSSWARASPRR